MHKGGRKMIKMAKESMTPEERISATLHMEKPDRVPIVPLMTPVSNLGLTGGSFAKGFNDINVGLAACFEVFDEYGGWDAMYGGAGLAVHPQILKHYPMKMRIPGKDLPDDYTFQLIEEEVLQLEDYEKICEMGFDKFYYEDYLWRITDLTPEEVEKIKGELVGFATQFGGELAKRGIKPWHGGAYVHPFFTLSLMRSMVRFTEDIYYRPEIVERTIKHMTAELIQKQNVSKVKQSGIGRYLLGAERAAGIFYPLSIFERFWLPYTREIVETFWSEGIVTIFHLDSCWNRNLPYFKLLPKGSYVLHFDGTTDIFSAKEVLRSHGIIQGDVPASMFSLGKPEDVEAYVKKLIDEVGADGGFILGSGCGVPSDAKPDNFRAMIETGKTYELSKA